MRLPLVTLILLLLTLPAHAQSLGMLLRAGLTPGVEGSLLKLAEGPLTGGPGTDLALLPAEGASPAGLLLGSQWGDLTFYAGAPEAVYAAPDPWLGAAPAQWEWPPVARQVSPESADWDGDGRPDLVLGWGNLLLWYPRAEGGLGAGRQIEVADGRRLSEAVRSQDRDAGHLAPAVGDYDGDGKPDLLLGAEDGTVWLVRNEAEQGFQLATPERVVGPTGPVAAPGGRARVCLADVTGDGRADLILGDARGGLSLYPTMPTGLGSRPSPDLDPPRRSPRWWAGVSPRLAAPGRLLLGEAGGFVRSVQIKTTAALSGQASLTDQGRLRARDVPLALGLAPALSLADADGDGALDLVVGDLAGTVTVYHNRDRAGGWEFAPGQPLRDKQNAPVLAEGGYAWPLLVDADGDRDLDLLLGTGAGRLELWMSQGGLIRGAPMTAGAGAHPGRRPAHRRDDRLERRRQARLPGRLPPRARRWRRTRFRCGRARSLSSRTRRRAGPRCPSSTRARCSTCSGARVARGARWGAWGTWG